MKHNFLLLIFLIGCTGQPTKLVFGGLKNNHGSGMNNSLTVEVESVVMDKFTYSSYLHEIFASPPRVTADKLANDQETRSIIYDAIPHNGKKARDVRAYNNFTEVSCDIYGLQMLEERGNYGPNTIIFYGSMSPYLHGKSVQRIGDDCSSGAPVVLSAPMGKKDIFNRQVRILKCEEMSTMNLRPFYHKFFKADSEFYDPSFSPAFTQENIVKAIEAFYPATVDLEDAALTWLKLDSHYADPETKWRITISGICQSLFWEMQ